MENKEKLSKKFWIIILSICSILLLFVIIGFVVFSNRKATVIEKNEDGGKAYLKYATNNNVFTIKNANPTKDEEGIKLNSEGSYYDFSVDTSILKASSIEYEVSIKKITKTINDKDIIVYLEKEESGTYNSVLKPKVFTPIKSNSDLGTPKGSMVLTSGVNKKSKIDNYRLRVWFSEKSQQKDATVSLEIELNAKAK